MKNIIAFALRFLANELLVQGKIEINKIKLGGETVNIEIRVVEAENA